MTPRTGSRGPYARTARVRQEIIEAAMAVFAEAGYRATTMKEIARRVGLTDRAIVHHFPNKEELLLSVLAARESESEQLAPRSRGEALAGMLAIANDNMTRPGLVELHSTLSAEATSTEHPAHEHYTKRYMDFREYLAGAFAELKQHGELRFSLEPDELASMLIALWDGLQLQWLYDNDAVAVQKLLRGFLDMVAPAAVSQDVTS
ncbi:TetR/AcrR family transcriptional regulator [Kibdelosporangium banguiense]|nr:TetR/AcrR family transcriptional regulator [Kibdelosporangium banguiense]